MKDFLPTDQSTECVAMWTTASEKERLNALKSWITQQLPASDFDFWMAKSPANEHKNLREAAQTVFLNLSQRYVRSDFSLPIEYMISLEKSGFSVFKMLSPYQLGQLIDQYTRSQNMHILRMCQVQQEEFHSKVLRVLCSKPIKTGRFETLWNALDWEAMVKHNGSNVILGLAELGKNTPKKNWSNFVQIISKTHSAKILVKRALNFPQKDDWITKIYLYAAGLEIWGGECVVPSRKPTLSQSFKDAMVKIQESHIHKPPQAMVEFVESFLLRDYLISEIAPKHNFAPTRRKI